MEKLKMVSYVCDFRIFIKGNSKGYVLIFSLKWF